jgi:hypothetical protein
MSLELKKAIDAYPVAKAKYEKVHNLLPDKNPLSRIPTLKDKHDIACLSSRIFLLEARTNQKIFIQSEYTVSNLGSSFRFRELAEGMWLTDTSIAVWSSEREG